MTCTVSCQIFLRIVTPESKLSLVVQYHPTNLGLHQIQAFHFSRPHQMSQMVWIYPIKDFHLSPTHRPLGVVGFLVILTRLVCHLKVLLQYIKGLYMLTQTIPITGLFLQALGKIPFLTLQLQLFHLLVHLKDLWCLKLLAMKSPNKLLLPQVTVILPLSSPQHLEQVS